VNVDAAFPLGPDFAGGRYAVLGLARSGLATVRALTAAGADVLAWDDDAERRAAAEALGAQLGDPVTSDLSGMAGVVVSPGVPLNRHPIAGAAKAAGVPVIGDIELFAQARQYLPPHKVVGITGTNGKSTTTALVHHILKTAGVPSLMGGNIGLPILAQQPVPAGGVYVLELSSYQIDLTFSLDCDVAVLLNVTPDHLDRYDGDFEAYRHSKLRLFNMQSIGHDFVVASNDPLLQILVRSPSAGPARAVFPEAGRPFGPRDEGQWPALQGPHNAQNVWAAKVCAEALGIGRSHVDRALETFAGLPHRMERIATVNGVLFVNDSKATNPEAAAPALAAYTNIHWILGGLAKSDSLGDCAQHYGHVARAYLIGTAAADFARAIGEAIPTEFSGDLETALTSAAANAKPGDVVLLSPAAASFDQFRDFEARGDAFRAWVQNYAGGQS
jgi:UDP-N-acetylmuramoylalanine--D-glutamate ligase